jgi:hypothetical protein
MAKQAHEPFQPHTAVIQRNAAGRFLSGCKPGPGRSIGSRNKLSESLLGDLAEVWETHGKAALIRCAEEEPGRFAQICVGLLPRNVELDVGVDITLRTALDAATAFRTLAALPKDKLLELHADDVATAETE